MGATLATRRQLAARMRDALAGCRVKFQRGAALSGTPFAPVATRSGAARAAVLAVAERTGVELRTYFSPPLHQMPAYSHHERTGTLPVTDRLTETILSLPMANDMTEEELARIVNCAKAALSVPDAQAA
jgi:dTDP-4-amino-4,6-dideoxygalactose transaminase